MRTANEFFKHLHHQGFRPATVVDVGVGYGTKSLYPVFPDAYYFLFEPVVDFEKHIKLLLTRMKGEFWPCALSETVGMSTIFRTQGNENATLMHRGIDPGNPRLQRVDVRTLDDIFTGREVKEPVLLKTDCQSADLNVIKGGRNFIQRCGVIVMEVQMFHYWGPHASEFTDVVLYMGDKGFVTYDLFGYLPRPFDGALGQIDMAFVKRDSPFRGIHKWL